MKRFCYVTLILVLFFGSVLKLCAQVNFTGPELLGRPTNNSVTVNVVADASLLVYFEYGTVSGVYANQTSTISSTANEPIEVVIGGLTPNTHYYYRMVYSANGGSTWVERGEHSFHTQRAPGSTFSFTIISDSHMNGGGGNVSLYQQTLANVNNDQADYLLDLGDTFWMDGVTSSTIANQRYLAQRQWMGTVSHSAAIFIATGNHENEEGWNFDDTNSKALLSVNARKRYYPNPITDGFYSGNDDPLPEIGGDQLRENYYAWEWGDALFVVIDPYHYTLRNPYVIAGGEDNDEAPASGDRWDWTLGQQQFNWFKQTLENSNAKYKFVFAHHMLGGSEDYVRGGAAPAHMFEWGGYNIDGTTWGFNTRRPGWGDLPIQQLMVANGVSAFFYGHDHEYAHQERDGVVYQLVPSPAMTGYGLNQYYQNEYTIKVLPNSGHLRVTVSPSEATINYVRSYTSGGTNGEVSDSYTILPNASTTYVKVAAKVFLEGPYDMGTNEMKTALNSGSFIPKISPYSEDACAVAAVPINVTDWVLVQLRSTYNGSAVASKSAFLHKDGRIVADDGSTNEIEMTAPAGSYYIVIKHCNHLSAMSASTVSLSSGSATLYNFTSGSSQFYGTGGAKELETNVWGLWSGDIGQDGEITTEDYTDWYNSARAGDSGYHVTDCNCDGQVTTEDYTIWYNSARAGASSQVPNP